MVAPTIARQRAESVLASVERTLSTPRAQGELHRPAGEPDESFEQWQERKRAEAEASARPIRRTAAAPVYRNSLAAMTDAQVVAMLGGIARELRREMLDEITTLANLFADLEARTARLATLVAETELRIRKMEGGSDG